MPYITQEDRKKIEPILGPLLDQIALGEFSHPGQINYVITKIIMATLERPSYCDFNKVMGVLECVKQEFYRRAVGPYEDRKIRHNGDVYD